MAVSVLLKPKRITSRDTYKKSLSKMKKEAAAGRADFSSSCRFLYRIPVAILLLMLLFLWSSSTTIISGSYVHVCVSSRKLNNFYCLSAGTNDPNIINEVFKFPVIKKEHNINSSSSSSTNSIISTTTTTTMINNISNYPMEGIVPAMHHDLVSVPPKIVQEINNQSGGGINTTGSGGSDFIYNKDEFVFAVKVVEEQLQVHRSWRILHSKGGLPCDGRGIFVYDLPSKFNKDLIDDECRNMVPWMNFCEYFTNEAMGQPIPKLGKDWYRTHQYSLEPIFHGRVLKHPCRVFNETEAKLFYVPYYGGLDILRWHFKNSTDNVKDTLSLELMKWLEVQQPWVKNSGKDHVFVLGKISWDFRRRIDSTWGTRFLELDEMQKPLKLLIERQPWHVNDISVPHPSLFHPHSDKDIIEWQLKIIRWNRKSLISFAGAARPGAPDNIRSLLIKQCTSRVDDEKCRFLDCKSSGCDQPESIIELFMESEFCLQPPGDSPTRKSVFDSLISGCIPVLFDPFTAYYQYPWHLPKDHRRYSVYIAKEEVRDMKVDVVERLMKVSLKEREEMRRYIVYEVMPGLVYGEPNSELDKFEDAFSISMNNLLDRVTNLDSS